MDKIKLAITQCLENLRLQTGADFSAFACQDSTEAAVRWKYAVGNRNERFRRIVLRPGKGIAGKVLLSGRLMIIENYEPKQHDDPREYPILYAEELKSALGIPVIMQDRVKGVVLLGYRNACHIEEKIIVIAKQAAEEVAMLLNMLEVKQ